MSAHATALAQTANRPLFSLLVCTVDRVTELERLLNSLRAQTYGNFEVIIVDQNNDDRIVPLLNEFRLRMAIQRVQCSRGLSRARNRGLAHCRGALIALPDDDCWYPPNLLDQVARVFHEHENAGFVIGRWQDELGHDAFGAWPNHGEAASAHHVWTRAISFTIFIRHSAVQQIGLFDERLGVGAGTPWGAGEETDYLLRAIETGIPGWYEPACIVHHPRTASPSSDSTLFRALSYGRGIGFVLRKHHAGAARILRSLVRPLGGAVLYATALNWRQARFHLLVFKGRCIGLLGERPLGAAGRFRMGWRR